MAAGAAAMNEAQLVIPMTGISSRFTAAGYALPKFLIEVDGQRMIEHVLDMYPGWTDVVFACNEAHLADPDLELERLLLDRVPTARIVALPAERRGPAWAVLGCRDEIDPDRPVIVNYCDFTAAWDTTGFAQLLDSGEVAGAIACYTGFHPHLVHSTSYAYARLDGAGNVVAIQEKQPWTAQPMREQASSGTYGFDSGARLLAAIEDQIRREETLGDEYYLSLTYRSLLRDGARVVTYPVPYFMQWGTPQDLEEYRAYSTAIAGWTEPAAATTVDGARVILAAGAGDRFRRAGYGVPKPALPMSGSTLLELTTASIPAQTTVLVTRDDLDDEGVVRHLAERLGAEIVSMPGLSQGQASSALAGLARVSDDRPVSVGACDALARIDPSALQASIDQVGADGMVCWTAAGYTHALRAPHQYGWVRADQDGMVIHDWMKREPDHPDAVVVIGTFTFGTAAGARHAIESMMADDDRVNGEFYLDRLIGRLRDAGKPVIAIAVDSFVSLGTPAEYESARYWQSCFNGWPLHPYKLAADPAVPPRWRARLARSMERPFETVVPWV